MRRQIIPSVVLGLIVPFASAVTAQQTLPNRPPVVPPRNAAQSPRNTAIPSRQPQPAQAPASKTQVAQTTTNSPAQPAGSTPCGQNANSAKQKAVAQVRGRLGTYGAPLPSGTSNPCQNGSPTQQTAAQNANSGANSSGSRAPLNLSTEGIGTFPGLGGYNLVAYSCFRNSGQVMCDFDVTNTGTTAANATSIYNDMHMVGSSGRIFPRTSAFFVDSDGSPFQVSQLTPGNKVRFVMEFQGVPDSYSTVELIQGNTVLQNVQITAAAATTTAAK
jgi:hypothetical protein